MTYSPFGTRRYSKPTYFSIEAYGGQEKWKALADKCKARDQYTCKACGYVQNKVNFRFIQADHIIPLSKKGTNKLSNLQSLCIICHKKKTNRSRKRRGFL